MDRRAGLDDVEEKFFTLPGLELRPLSRPSCTQSLYRLHYPGSPYTRSLFNVCTLGRRLTTGLTYDHKKNK
jgi:hypothetical protein